jgi:hypothetical protein
MHSLDWYKEAQGREGIRGTGEAQLQPFMTLTLDGDECNQLQAPTALTLAREVPAPVSIITSITIIIITTSSSSRCNNGSSDY